jgi:DNA-binding transcriptional LysR family regulator
MHPSIRVINIFATVVEKQSFANAARTLLIDPTVVSRAIKTLEEDLGVMLFRRSTRALTLTDEGAQFYRDCTEILQKLTEATERFRIDREMPHGRLKVGMAPSLSRRILLRVIPLFQKQYPHIEIVLLGIDDVGEIEKKSIDVLVRSRSYRLRGGLHREPDGMVLRTLLARSRRVVCASPAYLREAGTPREPADLLQHACVAFVSTESDVQYEWSFSKSHLRQKIRFKPKLLAHGTDTLREAALAGCGLIRLMSWNVDDELRSGKLVPVLSDWTCLGSSPLVAIYRKTRPMPLQVRMFVRHLAEAFRAYDHH